MTVLFTEQELLDFRADAEARMTDTCRITAPGEGQGSWNETTASDDSVPPVTIYEGKCRIKAADAGDASTAQVGPESWEVSLPILCLPVVGSEAVGASNQTVEYLTAAYDQALVGRKFGFTGSTPGSQTTARRLRMKEVVGS